MKILNISFLTSIEFDKGAQEWFVKIVLVLLSDWGHNLCQNAIISFLSSAPVMPEKRTKR